MTPSAHSLKSWHRGGCHYFDRLASGIGRPELRFDGYRFWSEAAQGVVAAHIEPSAQLRELHAMLNREWAEQFGDTQADFDGDDYEFHLTVAIGPCDHERRAQWLKLRYTIAMTFEFTADIWYWRGPAPHHFVTVPEEQCDAIKAIANLVTYGWGMIPVTAKIGNTEWKTSMWPKDGRYILPLKIIVRKAEQLEKGDTVTVRLDVL